MMNRQTQLKSKETTIDENMTLFLLLAYNKMKMYNENFSLESLKEKNKQMDLKS